MMRGEGSKVDSSDGDKDESGSCDGYGSVWFGCATQVTELVWNVLLELWCTCVQHPENPDTG